MGDADWKSDAACREDDPDGLFVRGAQQRRAKLVCVACPVRTDCLAEALDNRVEFGVWGGMTERERRALLRRRPDVASWASVLGAASRGGSVLAPVLERDPAVRVEFEVCYKAEFTRLVGFLIKYGAGEQEARDAAQTAFMEAYRQWERIQTPRAWLRKVALRSLPRSLDIPIDEVPEVGQQHALSGIEIADQTRVVVDALRCLPFRQREVMAWTLDGFTPTEIARELNLTPENVRKTLQRARAALKQRLFGDGEAMR